MNTQGGDGRICLENRESNEIDISESIDSQNVGMKKKGNQIFYSYENFYKEFDWYDKGDNEEEKQEEATCDDTQNETENNNFEKPVFISRKKEEAVANTQQIQTIRSDFVKFGAGVPSRKRRKR